MSSTISTSSFGLPLNQESNDRILWSLMNATLAQGKIILPALRAIEAEYSTGKKRHQWSTLCRVCEQGDVDTAMRALQDSPELWIPLLRCSKSDSGSPQSVAYWFSTVQNLDMKKIQFWNVVAYPVSILCLAIGLLVAISILVVPTFQSLYADFGLQMPVATQVMLMGSRWLSSGIGFVVLIVMGTVCVVVGCIVVRTRSPWSFVLVNRSAQDARFSRCMANLLEAGVSVLEAVPIAGKLTSHRYANACQKWSQQQSEHRDVSSTVGRIAPLTASVSYVLDSPMSVVSKIAFLQCLASCHEMRVQKRMSYAAFLLGPTIIVMTGIVVGFVVVALFLPLIKLVSFLSG